MKFSLNFDALIEAPTPAAAEQQRQAMATLLGNPMLKTLLETSGVKLVGYRVSKEIKAVK